MKRDFSEQHSLTCCIMAKIMMPRGGRNNYDVEPHNHDVVGETLRDNTEIIFPRMILREESRI